jgi:hypothetical protein
MTVSSLSICLALKKIADLTCGTRPEAVHIKVLDPWHRLFAVSLPPEYQSPVFSYLAQHICIQQPKQGQPVLLTCDQAAALVEFALRRTHPLEAA